MPTAIRFTASWCQPCKALARTLEAKGINIPALDIDEHKDLVAQYEIRSVPTIVIINDNGVIQKIVGATLSPHNEEILRNATGQNN